MKKLGILLLSLFLLLPLVVKAEGEEPVEGGKEKVKVYVFEAGGCPYCEEAVSFMEGLDSYETKFEIVRKKLYIDHYDFEPDVDYDLAVNVAKAFKSAGFAEADYKGTPFIVISDVYATMGYSSALGSQIASAIDEAYEAGDKDVVSCIAEGRDDCIAGVEVKKLTGKGIAVLIVSLIVLFTGIISTALYLNKKNTSK